MFFWRVLRIMVDAVVNMVIFLLRMSSLELRCFLLLGHVMSIWPEVRWSWVVGNLPLKFLVMRCIVVVRVVRISLAETLKLIRLVCGYWFLPELTLIIIQNDSQVFKLSSTIIELPLNCLIRTLRFRPALAFLALLTTIVPRTSKVFPRTGEVLIQVVCIVWYFSIFVSWLSTTLISFFRATAPWFLSLLVFFRSFEFDWK